MTNWIREYAGWTLCLTTLLSVPTATAQEADTQVLCARLTVELTEGQSRMIGEQGCSFRFEVDGVEVDAAARCPLALLITPPHHKPIPWKRPTNLHLAELIPATRLEFRCGGWFWSQCKITSRTRYGGYPIYKVEPCKVAFTAPRGSEEEAH